MRHIISSFLLLLVAISAMAQTDDCKVPISVVTRYATVATPSEYESAKEQPKSKYEKKYMQFFDHRGFVTDMKFTRLTFSIDWVKVDGSWYRLYRLIDMRNNIILQSMPVDTLQYPGTNIDGRKDDIFDNLPMYERMADTLRATIIDYYQANTKDVMKTAKEYASKGDHKAAFYCLSQYPECCQSYPQIRDCAAALFRDYMKKDHEALLKVAKHVWKDKRQKDNARFVVALLNSETFTAKEQKKVDKLKSDVAAEYPALNVNAKEEYTFVPELKAVLLREVRAMSVEYSYSDDLLEDADLTPKFKMY